MECGAHISRACVRSDSPLFHPSYTSRTLRACACGRAHLACAGHCFLTVAPSTPAPDHHQPPTTKKQAEKMAFSDETKDRVNAAIG